jgi:hypothetical protein
LIFRKKTDCPLEFLYADNEHINNSRKPLPSGEGLGWGQGGWFLVFFANKKIFNSFLFKIKSIIHPRFGPTLALPGGRPEREFWGEPVGRDAILRGKTDSKQENILVNYLIFKIQ